MCLFLEFLTLALPRIGNCFQELWKPHQTVTAPWREVRACEERLPCGKAKDGHWPPPRAIECNCGIHVKLVDIRSLFPVDLYWDEVTIEQGGSSRILEGFPGHHVAPMTRKVPDRYEQGSVLFFGQGQGLWSPGHPVHWIVGVCAQVRACLARQAIAALPAVAPLVCAEIFYESQCRWTLGTRALYLGTKCWCCLE